MSFVQISPVLFLDVDDNFDDKNNYLNKYIYVPQQPLGSELSFCHGLMKKIYDDTEYDFAHSTRTLKGSSGEPIVIVLLWKSFVSTKENKRTQVKN